MEPTPQYNVSPRQRSGLIERLGSPRREEREAADWQIRSAGGDPVHFLIGELHALPQVLTWRFSLLRFGQNLFAFCSELLDYVATPRLSVTGASLKAEDRPNPPAVIPTLSEMERQRRRVGRVIRALAWYSDLRVVGPLCERMHDADEDTQWRAQLTLKNLLPRLQTSDAALCTLPQCLQLYRLLKTHDEALLIAVLQAIGAIGDSRALLEVEHHVHSHINPAVRQAAHEALRALHLRAEQERLSQTLLRGASAPASSPDSLLRPAIGGVPPVNPNQMLRAASAEASQSNTQENSHHAQ